MEPLHDEMYSLLEQRFQKLIYNKMTSKVFVHKALPCVTPEHTIYFLKYSLGLKLNLILNWTRVNLPIQINRVYCNRVSIWTRVIFCHEIN